MHHCALSEQTTRDHDPLKRHPPPPPVKPTHGAPDRQALDAHVAGEVCDALLVRVAVPAAHRHANALDRLHAHVELLPKAQARTCSPRIQRTAHPSHGASHAPNGPAMHAGGGGGPSDERCPSGDGRSRFGQRGGCVTLPITLKLPLECVARPDVEARRHGVHEAMETARGSKAEER